MLSAYFSDQSMTFAALSAATLAVATGALIATVLGC